MKHFSIHTALLVYLCFVTLSAQSLIGQVTLPPENPTRTPPLLNPAYSISQLEPLPQLELPVRLPPELTIRPNPGATWAELLSANRAVAENRATEALEIYEAFLAHEPGNLLIQTALGDAYYSLKRYPEAIEAYQNVLKINPIYFQALNNLSWLYCTVEPAELRNPAEALALTQRARVIQPDNHYVWSTLSQAYLELGRYPEALAASQQALQLLSRLPRNDALLVKYLVQLTRCQHALQATSLLE
jgi:tetratricopeptide (TPR) repeat protein